MNNKLKKILSAVLIMSICSAVPAVAFAETEEANARTVNVNGILLDVAEINEEGENCTTISVKNPQGEFLTAEEELAIETFANGLPKPAMQRSTSYIPLSIQAERNNGKYKVTADGQWYRDTSRALLSIQPRLLTGKNGITGYSGRVIRIDQSASFTSVGVTGLSISATGFSVNGGSNSKEVTKQGVTHYDTDFVSIQDNCVIESRVGLSNLTHYGTYEVSIYTGNSGGYFIFSARTPTVYER